MHIDESSRIPASSRHIDPLISPTNTGISQEHSSLPDHGSDHAISLIPVMGLPEFTPESDLAHEITQSCTLHEGDVIVVTSKIISKIEGKVVHSSSNPQERDDLRRELILSNARRILARKGKTLITENHLGIIQAASGIDGSNVESDKLLLLPDDPDASAATLLEKLQEITGITHLAVIITDTMGRAWRMGQIDLAIGSAGINVLHDYEGSFDSYGNPLLVTQVCIADEIASATDLVKGKLSSTPVAIVRGYSFTANHTAHAKDIIRDASVDLFGLGVEEARLQGQQQAPLLRRSVRKFISDPVPENILTKAVQHALTAPAPHHSKPMHYVLLRDQRENLLTQLRELWRADLLQDKFTTEQIERRLSKGNILWEAPEVIIPCYDVTQAHQYRDDKRNNYEETMFTVAAGASIGTLLISLASFGVGSCWIGSTIFAPEHTTRILDLPPHWKPLGAIAVGYPEETISPRQLDDVNPLVYR